MKSKFLALQILAGGLVLAACSGPVMPITPDTLAGCWQGELLGATAKVDIARATEANVYNVNGEGKFGGNTYPISNIQVEYNTTTGDLNPRNLSTSVPVKLKVDGAEIKATATGTPFSINLKRCPGSSIPSPTSSASASPSAS
jgi:hypothetical protein